MKVYAVYCEIFDVFGFFTVSLDNKKNNKAPEFKRLWNIAYERITSNVKGSADKKKTTALAKKTLQSFKTSYLIVRPFSEFDTLQVLSVVFS